MSNEERPLWEHTHTISQWRDDSLLSKKTQKHSQDDNKVESSLTLMASSGCRQTPLRTFRFKEFPYNLTMLVGIYLEEGEKCRSVKLLKVRPKRPGAIITVF